MIQQLLYKYLVLNGRLGLPDIGSFTIYRRPASVDASGTVLLSPSQQVQFESIHVQADKNLFVFLAQEIEADEVTAIGKFNEWVKLTKEKLAEESVAELPYMGALRLTVDGAYRFEAFPPGIGQLSVDLPEGMIWKTSTAENDTTVEAKDAGWWIYAIILLLLGLAAIAYRYL